MSVAGLAGAISLSAGESHTCALLSGGAVKCWGNNFYGQLGNGTRTHSTALVDVAGLTSGVLAITAGDHHTCALLSGGAVKCWGLNGTGKLGTATDETCGPDDEACSLVPVDVAGLTDVVAIDAGGDQTCARTAAGAMMCWGANYTGQLGGGSAGAFSQHPVEVTGLGAIAVAIMTAGEDGYGIACAVLADGTMQCWGDNSEAQLGNGEGGTFGEMELAPGYVLGVKQPPVTPTASPVATVTPTPGIADGDTSCDGVTDAIDAALLLQLSALVLAMLPCPAAADVNQDGSVSSVDAALVLQYAAGLVPSLPV
jgi:hypothetical protein